MMIPFTHQVASQVAQWVKNPPVVQQMQRAWQPIPVFPPGEFHGQRSLMGCSPRGSERVGHDWATKQWQQLTCITVSFFPIKKMFYLSIVALQCWVSFYCIAKWFSRVYTYIPSCLDFLPVQVPAEHWVEFPVLYSRLSSVINFIHSINSTYTCQSWSPSSSPHSLLVSTHLSCVILMTVSWSCFS